MEWPWWATLIIVLVALEVAAMIYFIRKGIRRKVSPIQRQEAISQDAGQPAKALVLETQSTNMMFGQSVFVVRLRLQVKPSFGSVFETTIDAAISVIRIHDFAEGKEISVLVDPDTRAVTINQRLK